MVFSCGVLYMALDVEKDELCFVVVAVVLFFAYPFLIFLSRVPFGTPIGPKANLGPQKAPHFFRKLLGWFPKKQNESKMMQQNVDANKGRPHDS